MIYQQIRLSSQVEDVDISQGSTWGCSCSSGCGGGRRSRGHGRHSRTRFLTSVNSSRSGSHKRRQDAKALEEC
jgi:hypothetical protein